VLLNTLSLRDAGALTQTPPFPITTLGSLAAGGIAEDPLAHAGCYEPWDHVLPQTHPAELTWPLCFLVLLKAGMP